MEQPYNPALGDLDEFVQKNKKLVFKEANKFINHGYKLGMDTEDIQSMGMIGLIKAYKKFDPSYGFAFSTYAVPVILGEIRRNFRDASSNGMKFSRSVIDAQKLIYKAELFNETPEVIAVKLDLSLDTVLDALAYHKNQNSKSLDETAYNDEDASEITLGDKYASYTDFTTLEVKDFLDTLDEREREIIQLRVYEDKTQFEVADAIGVSQVQVSRILNKIALKAEGYFGRKSTLEKQRRETQVKQAKGDVQQAKEMVKLHHENKGKPSLKSIATMSGVHYNTVINYNREYRAQLEREQKQAPVTTSYIEPTPKEKDVVVIPNALKKHAKSDVQISLFGDDLTVEELQGELEKAVSMAKVSGDKKVAYSLFLESRKEQKS